MPARLYLNYEFRHPNNFVLVIQNYEFSAVPFSHFLWFMSAKVWTIPKTAVRRDTDCVRWISCLPYAEYWTIECPRVAFAPSFYSWLFSTHTWATLTKSGHNKICEVLRLGRLEILSASVSGGHRYGMVQTLSYTKIMRKWNCWKIQQFRLKSHQNYQDAWTHSIIPIPRQAQRVLLLL